MGHGLPLLSPADALGLQVAASQRGRLAELLGGPVTRGLWPRKISPLSSRFLCICKPSFHSKLTPAHSSAEKIWKSGRFWHLALMLGCGSAYGRHTIRTAAWLCAPARTEG